MKIKQPTDISDWLAQGNKIKRVDKFASGKNPFEVAHQYAMPTLKKPAPNNPFNGNVKPRKRQENDKWEFNEKGERINAAALDDVSFVSEFDDLE